MTSHDDIEPATLADLDALEDHWVALVESQREYGSHLLGEVNRGRGRDVLAQYIAADNVGVAKMPAENSGKERTIVAGFVMFYLEEGMYDQGVDRGIVENLYVVPAERNSGLGSALLAYAETELADRGAEIVGVSVMADNEEAREFYRERSYAPHRLVLERELPGDEETN